MWWHRRASAGADALRGLFLGLRRSRKPRVRSAPDATQRGRRRTGSLQESGEQMTDILIVIVMLHSVVCFYYQRRINKALHERIKGLEEVDKKAVCR